ncbi:modulator of smoothened protein isoform X1 [Orcinus orca]|uniref:modulator of smoothened protein isoform X1 n=1 Tax=Orcinus orca TaxID=9733 RepID=UPI0014415341|nr:modulator of smoothened protein isoform X1 [Orcinus orca]
MDKLTIISGCLFLAADIFAIASIANPDWINTGESAGALTVGLVRQCQTIHGRDRTCIPPRLPPEWVTTLFFIIMGIISLTVTCGLLVASHWRREATKYARWIAFTGRASCGVGSLRQEDQDDASTLSILKRTLWRLLQACGFSVLLKPSIHLVCFAETWFCQDGFNYFC